MVKIGGKAWRELVRDGILPNEPRNKNAGVAKEMPTPKEVFQAETEDEAKNMQEKLKEVVPAIKANHHPTRKGKKIVEVANRVRQGDIAQYTAQCASRTLHKHMNTLAEQLESAYQGSDELDDSQLAGFEEGLKNLILEEMLATDINDKPNKSMRDGKKITDPDSDYELDDDDYEEEKDDLTCDNPEEYEV